mmetsp:Transcript_24234/g.31656  ORF Transcript_24234/g.31656 Transcript_24234/m.31656 type:complete len:1253 (+) Transcript_24234:428-4186(+)
MMKISPSRSRKKIRVNKYNVLFKRMEESKNEKENDEDYRDSSMVNLTVGKGSLRFSDPQMEKNFRRVWKRRRKRWTLLLFVILSFILFFVKLVLFTLTSSNCSWEPTLYGVLLFASFINYWNYKRRGSTWLGNHILYLIGLFAVLGAQLAVTRQNNIEYYEMLKTATAMIQISFAAPIIGGLLLDIDFRVVLLSQLLIFAALAMICRPLVRPPLMSETVSAEAELLFQLFLGCTASSVITYVVKRDDRMSFIRDLQLRRQESKRMEEKLKHQNEVWEAKGRYIAQVAHDIGTPLATFSLAVELLRDLATTAEMKDIIETAQCAIDLMTVTRKEALDHAKHMEGVDLQPVIKEVELVEVLKRCSRLMEVKQSKSKNLSGKSGYQQEFYLDPKLPSVVFSDYDWIWTMVVNFLSNAKKYSNDGQVIITVYEVAERGMFRVEVADNGIGVPADRRQHLFKPFGQLMKCAGGTGLGLHGVYMKATALEGAVGVRENPASATGSIFWFEVPARAHIQELSGKKESHANTGSILFLGEWSLGLRAKNYEYLKKRFRTVEHSRNLEEFLADSELVQTRYSVVFWLIDEDLAPSHKDLVSQMQKMKALWTKPLSDEGLRPLIYVSCNEFQAIEETPPLNHPLAPRRRSSVQWPSVKRRYSGQVSRHQKAFTILEPEAPISEEVSTSKKSIFFPIDQKTPDPTSSHFEFPAISLAAQPSNLSPPPNIESRSYIVNKKFHTEHTTLAKVAPLGSQSIVAHSPSYCEEAESKKESSRPKDGGVGVSHISPSGFSTSSDSTHRGPTQFPKSPQSWSMNSPPNNEDSQSSTSRLPSLPQIYTESPCLLQPYESRLLMQLDSASSEADCGIILQHPLSVCDIRSLVLRIPGFRVAERQVDDVSLEGKRQRTPPKKAKRRSRCCSAPISASSMQIDKTVLLVDDDPTILKFTSTMLGKQSYIVTTKKNGFEGLNALKEREYQVAIIDLNMPVMDGLECIRRFREWELSQLQNSYRLMRQPIIMFSANCHQSHREEALSLGADEFVAKPVKITELLAVITELKHATRPNLKNYSTPLDKVRGERHVRRKSSDTNIEAYMKGKQSHPPKRNICDLASMENQSNAYSVTEKEDEETKIPAKSLLLVDDDSILLKMSSKRFERQGYKVTTETNGKDALALLMDERNFFDAVILDHQMPIMDGIECIRRLREWESKQQRGRSQQKVNKIFLLSGADLQADPAMASFINDFKIDKTFLKPIDFDKIVSAIEDD